MDCMINVHTAKTNLSKLLDEVRAGESIVLAKAGVPYARLVPITTITPARKPGRLAGKHGDQFFAPLPRAELAAWDKPTCICCSTRTH